jgi:hypothetical protein
MTKFDAGTRRREQRGAQSRGRLGSRARTSNGPESSARSTLETPPTATADLPSRRLIASKVLVETRVGSNTCGRRSRARPRSRSPEPPRLLSRCPKLIAASPRRVAVQRASRDSVSFRVTVFGTLERRRLVVSSADDGPNGPCACFPAGIPSVCRQPGACLCGTSSLSTARNPHAPLVAPSSCPIAPRPR